MALVIKGASLLGEQTGDLYVDDAGVLVDAAPAGAETIDADGLVALPGLVDLHTHLREPGREDAETDPHRLAGRRARRLHRGPRDGQHLARSPTPPRPRRGSGSSAARPASSTCSRSAR